MRRIVLILMCIAMVPFAKAQKSVSPYEWEWTRDGIWTGAGIAVSGLGLYLITQKEGITEAELAGIVADRDRINFLDRWVAGNDSESANKISDHPFALSFAMPFVLLFDDEVNDHALQVMGLYIESLATTAAIYTLTAGLVNRSRPYVYSEDVALDRRLRNNGQRSFYSGHVAATATATFFAAKAYSDFNPDARGKGWIWAGAAALPAAVGYFRLQAGQHFLTDNLLGYALGATAGYFIPELHKIKGDHIDLFPGGGRTPDGISYNSLTFRLTF